MDSTVSRVSIEKAIKQLKHVPTSEIHTNQPKGCNKQLLKAIIDLKKKRKRHPQLKDNSHLGSKVVAMKIIDRLKLTTLLHPQSVDDTIEISNESTIQSTEVSPPTRKSTTIDDHITKLKRIKNNSMFHNRSEAGICPQKIDLQHKSWHFKLIALLSSAKLSKVRLSSV